MREEFLCLLENLQTDWLEQMMFISSLSAFPESLLTFFSSSHNTIAVSPLRQHVGEVRRISHSPAPSSARLFPCNLHKHPLYVV